MNPPPPAQIPSFKQAHELPGFIIFIVVLMVPLLQAEHLQETVMQWLSLHGGRPGADPPWYFITRDFATGICGLGALLLGLVAALAIWKWWPANSIAMVWLLLLYHGPEVARSWIIYQSCPGLLDGQRITTRWPTFDSYLYDPGIAQARTVIQISLILIVIVLSYAYQHTLRRRVQKYLREATQSIGSQDS